MNNHTKTDRQNKLKIHRIETTSDRLTGRAGLALFVAYLHETGIFPWIDRWFGTIRKSRKGLDITEIFKQVLCFMTDGTSRRLTYFDELAKDDGYAAAIETDPRSMASSHQIKRFFKAFAWTRVFLFRWLLKKLFLWRLQISRPGIIELDNDRQMYLPGMRPDTVIVTNIGQGQTVDLMLERAEAEKYLTADGIVASYHNRGIDELANRALKDFGHEQLPFKRFNPNAAWYYMMLLGHFLLESFKEDVGSPVIPVGSYASTVRRRLIDIAGKIVSHAGEIILKVSKASFEGLRLPELFQRCKCVTPVE